MDDSLLLQPFTGPVQGRLTLPGSKSITNRALVLAALSGAEVRLEGALFSRDTQLMINALKALGSRVQADEARAQLTLTPATDHAEAATLEVGNAGTVARFISALAAARPHGRFTLTGDAAMHERPMAGLVQALAAQGAQITSLEKPDCLPFELEAQGLSGGKIAVEAAASSQFVSALMLAGTQARAPLELVTEGLRWPFVRLTAGLMRQFGYRVDLDEGAATLAVEAPQTPEAVPAVFPIEGDVTAASYWLALTWVHGGTLELATLPERPLQGDVAFADLLERFGLEVERGAGTWQIRRSAKSLPDVGGTYDFANFSDTFLTLAALAPLAQTPLTLTGLAHTRRQETDRVAAAARELERLGQAVSTTEDTLTIRPSLEALRAVARDGVTVKTYEDHRIAMSFAVLGSVDVLGDGRAWLRLEDPMCCRKTYPRFFDELERLRTGRETESLVIVAVDGGAAAGKSSTSRGVAAALDFLHVDTGAHYRAVTRALLDAGVSPEDEAGVAPAVAGLDFTTQLDGRSSHMVVGGRAFAREELRSDAVNAAVPLFAALPVVREAVKGYQRAQVEVAREAGLPGLIMEGRDIGTVIFPRANLKIFLEADAQTRQERREREGSAEAVARRDARDSARKAAPLARADDAVVIDNSTLSLEEVIARVVALVEARCPR